MGVDDGQVRLAVFVLEGPDIAGFGIDLQAVVVARGLPVVQDRATVAELDDGAPRLGVGTILDGAVVVPYKGVLS